MRTWMFGLALLLLTAACTASRPPTPTPPPASDGGNAEATRPSMPSPTPSPTATPEPSPTPTPTGTPDLTATAQAEQVAATATAQAEQEQAEEQLWQEIEELKQAFEEGYPYTLEEPYQLRVDVGRSPEMVIAGLVTQEFQFVKIGDQSLWDRLNEIGRLAEQAGYRMELHVDGTVYLHEDGGAKYPIHLEDWVAKSRRKRLNFVRWSIEGPGVRIIESQYIRVATHGFLTDPAGRATSAIYKRSGEGEQTFELSVILKPLSTTTNQDSKTVDEQEVSLGKIYFRYKAYYEQDASKGFANQLKLLPGTEFQFATP